MTERPTGVAPGAPVLRIKDRLRYLAIRSARRLPWPVSDAFLRGLGVVYGILAIRYLRVARDWAAQQPGTRRPWRLAVALLANGTRAFAAETLIAHGSPEAVRGRFVLEGIEHLEAAQRQGATILLGFHLAPGVDPLALRIFGYRLVVAGGGQRDSGRPDVGWALRQAAWARFLDPGENPFVVWRDLGSRVTGLRRLRRLLLDGRTVWMTADGPGAEAFRVTLPGGDIVIRAGWFVLRRHTRATTLPLLTHRQGSRLVITIHPPLPAPEPDPDVDLAACRAALSPTIAAYVRRFPEECYSLAFSPIIHLRPRPHSGIPERRKA